MVDFFHIWLDNPCVQKLLENPLLINLFTMKVGTSTGEIKTNIDVAKYRNITFKIIDKCKIDISGSLHKYYQNGNNYKDFSFDDLRKAILIFCSEFDINPIDAKLKSFEFGINLNLIPSKYINSATIHQTKKPDNDTYNGNGLCKIFEHQRYLYKLYDKGAESKIDELILRLEIKFKKMIAIKDTGIKSFKDLMDSNKFKKLKNNLIKPLQEMVFFEEINTKKMNKKDASLCDKSQSADYWESILKQDREDFKYKRKRYNKLINLYGINLQKELIQIVENKLEFLMPINNESKNNSLKLTNTIIPQINQHFIPRINQHFISVFYPQNYVSL